MGTSILLELYDVDGRLTQIKTLDNTLVDDYILSLPGYMDAGEVVINGIHFYVDELKDIILNKDFC